MKVKDSGPKLTLDQINVFEQETGGQLPDDYKQFLLNSNGGFPEPPVGFPWEGDLCEVGYVIALLPTPDEGLRSAFCNLRELNINGLVTIARSSADDICVASHGNVGAIYFVRFLYEGDLAVGAVVHPLADSFTEFLENLVEIPTPYCRVEELGKQGTPLDLDQYLAENNSLDALSKNNFTIVCEAIKFGNFPMIHACIDRQASLSRTIYMAVQNGHIDLLQLLIESGADVNERHEFGRTPIEYVGGTALPGEEGERNLAMLTMLLKLGAVR